MDNRVGDTIPPEAEVAKLVRAIEAVAVKVERYTVKLTAQERKGLLKFRPGGEAIVELVARLAIKYKSNADDTPVDGMKADLELSQRLRPLTAAAELLARTLDDTELEAEGECWHAATANYTLLNLLARNNPTLASELEPARAFFATGPRRKKPGPG